MNARTRRRGLLAAVIFVLLLIPIGCNGPGYGGGGDAASGAPAAAPAGAPTAAPASGGGKYGY